MQPRDLLVDVAEARCEPRDAAAAFVSGRRRFDGARERHVEGAEAARARAGLREGEELAFRFLDLPLCVHVLGRRGREARDLAADADELAAQREIVDEVGVVARLRGQPGGVLHEHQQVARAADLLQAALALEPLAQGEAVGELAAPDEIGTHRKDAPVHGIVEVVRLEPVADAVEGLVVEQDRAEQRLLGFEVVRRGVERVGHGGSVGTVSGHSGSETMSRRARGSQGARVDVIAINMYIDS
ncbi:MAG: Replicative DNA helicase [Caulobacteraceae bacterium]|nr:MAG: Replicative DNA helicase [Caulobacteraceae bacterium]